MDGDHGPVDGVDQRVVQLQHALDSRVAVEQAKGMLAERYSITPGDAFELIRLAARSNHLKVNAVANDVLASKQTPPEIRELLNHLPSANGLSGDARARAVENVFREINDAYLKLDSSNGSARFVCECADTACLEMIELPRETMLQLHANPNLYAVKAGHEIAQIEEVVELLDGIVIVRKTGNGT
jgi:ANTAR domain-containing protein